MIVPNTTGPQRPLGGLRPDELALALDDAARFRDGRAAAICLDCAGSDEPCQVHTAEANLADRYRAAALVLEDVADLYPAGPGLVLSAITLAAIQAEATRAHLVHGTHSMLAPSYSSGDRLAILAEEFGEVAAELTYDHQDGGQRDRLVKELLQLAAMAASWVEALEGQPYGARAPRSPSSAGAAAAVADWSRPLPPAVQEELAAARQRGPARPHPGAPAPHQDGQGDGPGRPAA